MNSNQYDISVIIPVYNVEEYLAECLDSMLRQGNIKLEVIMINDGSTDDSEAIARKYTDAYDNFFLYTIPNGGLGHARNYAIQFAHGKYIIFLDSDDVIVDATYEKMFLLAEKNNSDMTICNVIRFNSSKSWESSLHANVFSDILDVTHITRNSNLIYDTTSWNKLIRRDFYLEHKFQFPENILYEDIPVTIPLHYLANHVSVLNEIGYLWRVRDGATKSITQNTSRMDNLMDRIRILEMLDKFFDENVKEKELHIAKAKKALEVDLLIFVNECNKIPPENAREVLKLVNEYIDKAIDESFYSALSIANQQRYAYVRANDLDGLVRLIEYQNDRYYNAPVREENGRLITELPSDLFTVPSRDVTDELGKSAYKKYIDDITTDEKGLQILCHIMKRRINISSTDQQQVKAYLYNEMAEEKLELKVVPEVHPELTRKFGVVLNEDTGKEEHYNYDGVSFRVFVNLDEIPAGKFSTGINKIMLEYKNRLSEGRVSAAGCSGGTKAAYNHFRVVSDHRALKITFGYMNELKIRIEDNLTYVNEVRVENGEVVITTERPCENIFVLNKDTQEKLYLKQKKECCYAFPANVLTDAVFRLGAEQQDTDKEQFLGAKTKTIDFYEYNNSYLSVNSTRDQSIKLALLRDLFMLDKVEGRGNRIRFCCEKLHAEKDIAEILLFIRNQVSGTDEVLAKEKNSAFEVNFGDSGINKNMYAGTRELYVRCVYADGTVENRPVYAVQYFKQTVLLEDLRIDIYRSASGLVKINLQQRWKKGETTAQNRKALLYKKYPQFRKEPLNEKLIVFESMWGSKYSCNPQAIYEYIDKNYPEYTCVWSLKDPRMPINGNGIRVRKGSLEYYHYLATAKYLINNVNFENEYVKRDGQIEVQTMHGTPLKTFGLDVTSEFPTERIKEQFLERNARWNYLVVQGKFMEEKALSCLNFSKKTLTTGYPRTDKLFENDPAETESIKKSLGIPLDKKVIFYAPTWRIRNKFDMQLDLEKLRTALSDEYVIMIRIHYFSSKGYTIPEDKKFVFDLNNYGCVEDLYKISDVLITDYSSLMFDYALLDKPMIFYTYDMDEYCNALRGIYVDFKAEAPGPLCYTTDEVLKALQNTDQAMEECADRIRLFKDKYLTYEVADSSKRLVEEVINPKHSGIPVYKLQRAGRAQKQKLHDFIYEIKKSELSNAIRKLKRR